MLKLAYDFSARAVKTLRQLPIADEGSRELCEWQADDLPQQLAQVAPTNDLTQLRDDVVARAGQYKHSRGRDFTTHLEGVAGVLQRWDRSPLVIQTGLFHSAYSTQQYPYGLYDHTQREQLRAVLGVDGERLVFVFCTHDRVDLYAQAVQLAKAGAALPSEGLVLRNALTGSQALVPCAVLEVLLQVHAADLVEQLDGFAFEMIYALLAPLVGRVELPNCFHEMQAAGMQAGRLQISLQPRFGTLALAPLLGLNRELLPLRLALRRWLRRDRTLSAAELVRVRRYEAQFPYLLELPWLRLMHENDLSPEQQNQLRARCAKLYRAWGTTWLKTPFEHNRVFERLLLTQEPDQAIGLDKRQVIGV